MWQLDSRESLVQKHKAMETGEQRKRNKHHVQMHVCQDGRRGVGRGGGTCLEAQKRRHHSQLRNRVCLLRSRGLCSKMAGRCCPFGRCASLFATALVQPCNQRRVPNPVAIAGSDGMDSWASSRTFSANPDSRSGAKRS